MAAWLGAKNQISTFPFSYQLKCKFMYFDSSQELWSLQLTSWCQDLATSCCCYSCHHGVRVWLWAVVVTAANHARVWLGTVVVTAVIMVSGSGSRLWSCFIYIYNSWQDFWLSMHTIPDRTSGFLCIQLLTGLPASVYTTPDRTSGFLCIQPLK